MACEDRLREAEATIERLRAEIQAKDATIAEKDIIITTMRAGIKDRDAETEARDTLILKDAIMTCNEAIKAIKIVAPGPETKALVAESMNTITNCDSDDAILLTLAKTRTMLKKIQESAPPSLRESTDEDDKVFEYDTKTRNEKRGIALTDYMTRLGKRSLTSKEARVVLEQAEGRSLDRKIVLRAMDMAKSITRGTGDKINRLCRIKIPDYLLKPKGTDNRLDDSFAVINGGDGRDMLSRRPDGRPTGFPS